MRQSMHMITNHTNLTPTTPSTPSAQAPRKHCTPRYRIAWMSGIGAASVGGIPSPPWAGGGDCSPSGSGWRRCLLGKHDTVGENCAANTTDNVGGGRRDTLHVFGARVQRQQPDEQQSGGTNSVLLRYGKS